MELEPEEYVARLPRKRIGAGVLFVDAQDRVLLVEPTYKDHWELPGGVVEAEESPYVAAVREIQEELDLTVRPGRLLVVDWVPSGVIPEDGVMVVFDGGVLEGAQTAAITVRAEELRGWAWCDAQAVTRLLPPGLARRTMAALRARTDGTTRYLEDGVAVV